MMHMLSRKSYAHVMQHNMQYTVCIMYAICTYE